MLLAATNHPALLDEALWRRFDEVLTLGLPTVHQLRQVLRLRLRGVAHSGLEIPRYASVLRGRPHAAAEKLVIDARRNALLRDSAVVTGEDVDRALPGITARPW